MPTRKGKVLVAMSGGVDSSVAAALLLREGFEVVGCFMRLGSPGETLDELHPFPDGGGDPGVGSPSSCSPHSERAPGASSHHRSETGATRIRIGHQGCCSINDAADARLVAAELGIPFYVCNFKKDFGRIIDYFVDEYAVGRTPNPCVRCNDWLKFGRLHEYARQIDAQFIASGHYARVEGVKVSRCRGVEHSAPSTPRHLDTSTPRLLRGIDRAKDQSYVLFGMPREQLARTLLPIGGFEKSEVREMARRFGLPVSDKPDSQEICFVPDNDYAGLVERRRPEMARAGAVVDTVGNTVGAHAGQHRYTVGQRRGVGVALGYPLYVVGKDPEANTVTVGPREALLVSGCTVGEANWLVSGEGTGAPRQRGIEADGWFPALAQYRAHGEAVRSQMRRLPSPAQDSSRRSAQAELKAQDSFEVLFDEPQFAVAPGQALVLYDAAESDVVLGGGWIEKTVGS